jgi:hypothetical protein
VILAIPMMARLVLTLMSAKVILAQVELVSIPKEVLSANVHLDLIWVRMVVLVRIRSKDFVMQCSVKGNVLTRLEIWFQNQLAVVEVYPLLNQWVGESLVRYT